MAPGNGPRIRNFLNYSPPSMTFSVPLKTEVFVLDLHTTSASGLPFATVGDTLRNRHFAQSLPVTILLGIEEQLEGTMLEYL